MQQDTTKQNKL